MFILNYVVWYVLLSWAIELVAVVGSGIVGMVMLMPTLKDCESGEEAERRIYAILEEVMDVPKGFLTDNCTGKSVIEVGLPRVLLLAPVQWPQMVEKSINTVKGIYRYTTRN